MPLADGQTLLQPGGQIMPTTLLLAHPDLKTQRQLWIGILNEVSKIHDLA